MGLNWKDKKIKIVKKLFVLGCLPSVISFSLFFALWLFTNSAVQLRVHFNKVGWLNYILFSNLDTLVFQFLSLGRLLVIPEFLFNRLDIHNRPDGGLFIAVYSSFPSVLLKIITSSSNNEITGICIKLESFSLNIVNNYSRWVPVSVDIAKICQDLHGLTLVLETSMYMILYEMLQRSFLIARNL